MCFKISFLIKLIINVKIGKNNINFLALKVLNILLHNIFFYYNYNKLSCLRFF